MLLVAVMPSVANGEGTWVALGNPVFLSLPRSRLILLFRSQSCFTFLLVGVSWSHTTWASRKRTSRVHRGHVGFLVNT